MYIIANSRKLTFILFTAIVMILSSTDFSHSANSDDLRFLSPLPTGNTINDAWSPDGQNFFFAGDGGTILHYDGSTFTVMSTPTDFSLQGIHGTSMTDVWAVGGDPYSDPSESARSKRRRGQIFILDSLANMIYKKIHGKTTTYPVSRRPVPCYQSGEREEANFQGRHGSPQVPGNPFGIKRHLFDAVIQLCPYVKPLALSFGNSAWKS